ncbi:MAG TPA: MoxR family ATPase [Vicinamibacteria bacterium]
MRPEVRAVLDALEREGYVGDAAIATALHLSVGMRKPLLIEGDAGVGKTEVAKVLSAVLGAELIRLQCYEGIDVQTALYEWNYPRQLLHMKAGEGSGVRGDALEASIFTREFLLERPLLRALTRPAAPVLLIDEVDRADDGFEAFLLELLSEFQVTIPELGTIRAEHPPHVVLTSNHTREIGDALRRRCLYLYIEHPSLEKEVRIIRSRVPQADARLAAEAGRFVQALRERPLVKPPGVAETLDWTAALVRLRVERLEPEVVGQTLGCLLKDRRDLAELDGSALETLVSQARDGG